ncbi:hypothetical protein [Lacticaseibacillus absianus]|uniref:hypothetical protein n=1 Tax=Lacticaseibacillus absianus TaxID=2729623 RepID=UPI0015C6E26C|nr:hypothetical protein [Lacticaseibacillus absianus]
MYGRIDGRAMVGYCFKKCGFPDTHPSNTPITLTPFNEKDKANQKISNVDLTAFSRVLSLIPRRVMKNQKAHCYDYATFGPLGQPLVGVA